MGVPNKMRGQGRLRGLEEGMHCWVAPQRGNNVTTAITVRHVGDAIELSSETEFLPAEVLPLERLRVSGPSENGPKPWSSLSVTLHDETGERTLIFPSDVDAQEFSDTLGGLRVFAHAEAKRGPWELPAPIKGWELPSALLQLGEDSGVLSSIKNVSDYFAKMFPQVPERSWTRDDWLREEGQRCERWDHYYDKDKFPEHLVFMGLPFGRRGALWTKWVQQYNYASEEIGLDDETLQVIEQDVPRTHPSQLSAETIHSLRRVLIDIAKRRGYCQGVNYLASVPLQIGMDESTAIRLLNLMSYRVCPGYHDDPQLKGFLRDCAVCEHLLELLRPRHYEVLQNMNIPLAWVASEALLTLFSRSLPIALVCWIWDIILFFGPRALFATFVSFWDQSLLTAMEQVHDPSEALPLITAEFKNPQKARDAILRLPSVLPTIGADLVDTLRRREANLSP
eukprot:GEMP01034099.1.p1 GENE.GEMP01034099.1~~GEMP01034099.1.p1  ORF type:complete len:452 (+),score=88.57 GEMP01034099.1:78-1433(+)